MNSNPTLLQARIPFDVMGDFIRHLGWYASECHSLPLNRTIALSRDSARTPSPTLGDGFDFKEILRAALALDRKKTTLAQLFSEIPESVLVKHSETRLIVGRACARTGLTGEAESCFLASISDNPSLGSAYLEHGRLLLAQGKIRIAEQQLALAMASRTRIAFDGKQATDKPYVAFQPSQDIDIIHYRGSFFVLLKQPDTLGARAIAGELFEIRKSRSLTLLRKITRTPLVNAVLMKMRPDPGNSRSQLPVQSLAMRVLLFPVARRLLGGLAKLVAQQLFARPITVRVRSISDALSIADKQASKRSTLN